MPKTDRLAAVKALAARNFRVFPLKPNSKIPPKGSWLAAASDNEDSVGKTFQSSPDANIGIATGDGIMVLDFDTKHGKQGIEHLALMRLMGLPDTLTVKTPSGGVHLYFRLSNGTVIPNSVGKIAPDVDVRGHHGYVVGPGSTIDGVPYESANLDQPMADAPDWLIDECRGAHWRARERHADSAEPLGPIDTPEALARGQEYLLHEAPEAIEGDHGDITTFKVAARLKDFGIGIESTHRLMLEHWNDTKAVPPWDPDDLLAKVESAFKSGLNRPGSADAAAQFGKVELMVTARGDVPLTIADWLNRDLAEPDFLLGSWLSTSSRALLVAATGIGKTNIALALAIAAAAGTAFLHWPGKRPARVLFIDGEMSRRLMRQRIRDAVRRAGCKPKGLLVLSHEDIPDFAPLNTRKGQAMIEAMIERHGPFDLIVFDNIMCLIEGDQKDEESWRQTLPWVLSLTRRSIGQLWLHHTGHDESRSYGTKTREWQLDTVVHLTTVQRFDTDISFDLTFRKARERTPETRGEFRDVRVALVNDRWTYEAAAAPRKKTASPVGEKFLEALLVAVTKGGGTTATMETWQAECVAAGLIDRDAKPASARAMFSKYRREIVSCNLIGCEGDSVWIIQ